MRLMEAGRGGKRLGFREVEYGFLFYYHIDRTQSGRGGALRVFCSIYDGRKTVLSYPAVVLFRIYRFRLPPGAETYPNVEFQRLRFLLWLDWTLCLKACPSQPQRCLG